MIKYTINLVLFFAGYCIAEFIFTNPVIGLDKIILLPLIPMAIAVAGVLYAVHGLRKLQRIEVVYTQ